MESLGDKGLKKLKELTELYFIAKDLMINAEEITAEQVLDLQAINEFRSALDHVMKALAARFDLKSVKDIKEYSYKNIDKAYGHVYRAAYDALDWTSLNLKDFIVKELQGFPLVTIKDVLPEYYTTMRPRIEQIKTDIAKFRLGKDVEDSNLDTLREYKGRLDELHGMYKEILTKKSSLIDHKKRLKKEGRRTFWGISLRDIISAIIGGGIAALLLPKLLKLIGVN